MRAITHIPETRIFSSFVNGGGCGGAHGGAGGSKTTASSSDTLHSVGFGTEISIGALISLTDIA